MNNKEKIMTAAQNLFIEQGFASTSIKNILDEAGVSNGCLFNYFKSKDEIAQRIYIDLKNSFALYCKSQIGDVVQVREFLWLYWSATIQWAIENPKKKQFLRVFCNTPIIEQVYDNEISDNFSFLRTTIKHAIDTQEIISVDYIYFIYTFVGLTDGIVEYLCENPDKYTVDFVKNSFQRYWRMIVNF